VPPITNCWDTRGIYTLQVGHNSYYFFLLALDHYITKLDLPSSQAPKPILDFHHQNLREKAANFDWRGDPLIPKVKRAFGSRLADGFEFITLEALLLAG
jgi:hypothetical protein